MAERKQLDKNAQAKVLYLSYDGLTDPLGQSQILPYLFGLADIGYDITIISFEKKERFKISREQISNLCNSHKIDWVPLKYHKRPPILSTLFDLFRLRMTALKLHRKKNFSIVHCRSYLTALVGMSLKKRQRLKLLFDTRGFWVDERVEGGLWNLKNPLYRLIYKYFKGKEKLFMKEADSIVVLTEAARKEVLSWHLNTKITIIPCCVDLGQFDAKRFDENDRNKLRSELGINTNDFLLLYLGSLGTWYLYNDMISFFNKLKNERPNARFLFITQDSDKVEANPDLIVRTVPRNEVPKYIFASDASVCFIKPSFSKKGSSATKMAEVLAMGIPMITNSGWGDVEFLTEKVNNIFTIDSYDKSMLEMFLAHKSFKQTNDFFVNYFSLNKGIEKYSFIYQFLDETANV